MTSQSKKMPEHFVTIAIFLVFFVLTIGLTIFCQQSFSSIKDNIYMQKKCISIVNLISSDLQQAVPCQCRVCWGDNKFNSDMVHFTAGSTGVIFPNENTPKGDYLEFNKPNFDKFNPAASHFDPANPELYVNVKYYVGYHGGELLRETTFFDDEGNISKTNRESVMKLDSGRLFLQTKRLEGSFIEITVMAENEKKKFTGSLKTAPIAENLYR